MSTKKIGVIFLWVAIFGVGLLSLHALIGIFADNYVEKIPWEAEVQLSQTMLGPTYFEQSQNPDTLKVQVILDKLVLQANLREGHYKVYVSEDYVVNALSFPGGQMVVFRGLLDLVESENELAMVLAHELAHQKHRDPLKQLGRAFVFFLLFGNSLHSEWLSETFFNLSDRSFSRQQELAADREALNILVKTYGHASGATELFERFACDDPSIFRTHPLSDNRIQALKQAIQQNRYKLEKTLPSPFQKAKKVPISI